MLSRPISAILDALAALSPVECAGCGRADRSLCDDCRAEFVPAVTTRTLANGLTVFASLRYEGAVRKAVLAFKESGRTDVARPLGASLAFALRCASVPGAEVTAVPTSRAAWRLRGYDPVALLARRAGCDLAKVLVRRNSTTSQKTLGRDERSDNVRGSMSANGSLAGRKFVIVDDVVTTGATLVEAARALNAAGGEVVAGAALAFTPRHFGVG